MAGMYVPRDPRELAAIKEDQARYKRKEKFDTDQLPGHAKDPDELQTFFLNRIGKDFDELSTDELKQLQLVKAQWGESNEEIGKHSEYAEVEKRLLREGATAGADPARTQHLLHAAKQKVYGPSGRTLAPAGTTGGDVENVMKKEAGITDGDMASGKFTSKTNELIEELVRRSSIGISSKSVQDQMKEVEKAKIAQMELASDQAEEEKSAMKRMVDQNRVQMETLNMIQNSRNKADLEVRTALEAGMEDLRSMKINPFRIYKNGWAALAAAIGATIGAYAQGITGGKVPNTALQIIEKAERLDVEAQVHDYNNAKDKMLLANNMHKKMLDQYNDEEASIMKQQVLMKDWMISQLEIKKAGAKSEAAKLAADLLIKEQSQLRELKMVELKEVARGRQLNALSMAIDASTKLALGEQREVLAEKKGLGKGSAKENSFIAGLKAAEGTLANLEQVLSEEMGAIEAILGEISEKSPWAGAALSGVGAIPVELRDKIAGIITDKSSLIFALVKINDPSGRISDEDRKFFEKRGITWADVASGAWRAKLAGWRAYMERVKEATMNGRDLSYKKGSTPMADLYREAMLNTKEGSALHALRNENSVDSMNSGLIFNQGQKQTGGASSTVVWDEATVQ